MFQEEELDWYGLTIEEAEEKQQELEEEEKEASIKPLKYQFMTELIQDIKGNRKIYFTESKTICCVNTWFNNIFLPFFSDGRFDEEG